MAMTLDQVSAAYEDLLNEAIMLAQRGGFPLTRDYRAILTSMTDPESTPDPTPDTPTEP